MWRYDSSSHELEYFDVAMGKRIRFSQKALDRLAAEGWKGASAIVLSTCLPRAIRG